MIHYLVAKYVDDLARNEPKNIGIVVYDGTHAAARFDGEDEGGRIDLRRVRHRITGSKSYRAWVVYWRAALESPAKMDKTLKDVAPGDPAVMERLLNLPARDFYIDRGGTILADAEDRSLRQTLDDLFIKLVREPDPPAPPDLRAKTREALAIAGAPLDDESRFREDVEVTLDVGGVSMADEVTYAVMNGDWHYLQAMPFDPGSPRRTRKEATHCAFIFEHAAKVRQSGVILYDRSDMSEGGYDVLTMLMRFAPTIDVSEVEQAAERLHEHLKL